MHKPSWRKTDRWRNSLFCAVLVAIVVMAAELNGAFQLLEVATFDRHFRLRSQEPIADRIVLVTIDEADLKAFGRWPLPDRLLAETVRRLQGARPAVIGINLYRDLPVEPGYEDWLTVLKTTPNVIGVERILGTPVEAPPPLQNSDRAGFADFVLDGDGKVRRLLLSHDKPNGQLQLSFSARVSLLYLEQRGIRLESLDRTQKHLKLGRAEFYPLSGRESGYANANAGGYQMLLNYRGLSDRFRQISIRDLLEDRVSPSELHDRIVLVGSTADSLNDIIYTPYSNSLFSTPIGSPSVVVHANAIDTIVSAALENRLLLRGLPWLGEILWTLSWAVVGALVAQGLVARWSWRRHNSLVSWLAMGSSLVLLSLVPFGCTYVLFQVGWWFPSVAPVVALTATATLVASSRLRQRQQESDRRLLQFLEALPVGICVLESDGSLYYNNYRASEILGDAIVPGASDPRYPCPPAYINGTHQQFPETQTPAQRALKGDRSEANVLDVRLGDRLIPLEMWGSPIFDSRGEVRFAAIAFQDISARQKAEAERERTTRELYELNLSLDRALNAEVELTDAAGRFVPHEFLSFLGYESLVDVELGKAVEKEMSVLFSDIRDFTTLSEQMSLDDNFKFINAYLSRMEPAISENHGFIDKYIGDAIMALFGGSADDAVRAGIAMLQRLQEYNQTRQRPERRPLRIGIGINTGSLMLGTIGGKHHMDSTVISDAVNLAARIESLTKVYGLPLLISHATFLQLEDTNRYAIRLIDRVQVKGKTEKISVFEVFDADPQALKAAKLAQRTTFEQAVMMYHLQSYTEAAQLFHKCLTKVESDRACQTYLERCQNLLENDRPI